MTPSFGASGQLAEQIKGGAPFDIFLAANQAFVRDLAAQGLIKPDSVRPYARGSLVLAVYHQVGDDIGRLEDLAKPSVKKIALANPDTAPYGKAGKQALERAGLWKQLEPKIVLAESVRQALLYVQDGNAEAGLVGRAIARVEGVRIVEINADLYDPIIQALGIVAASSRSAEAESFAEFVLVLKKANAFWASSAYRRLGDSHERLGSFLAFTARRVDGDGLDRCTRHAAGAFTGSRAQFPWKIAGCGNSRAAACLTAHRRWGSTCSSFWAGVRCSGTFSNIRLGSHSFFTGRGQLSPRPWLRFRCSCCRHGEPSRRSTQALKTLPACWAATSSRSSGP